jgi:hypothetical protein
MMLTTLQMHGVPARAGWQVRQRRRTLAVCAKTKEQQYVSPSSRTSSTELERLEALSTVCAAAVMGSYGPQDIVVWSLELVACLGTSKVSSIALAYHRWCRTWC